MVELSCYLTKQRHILLEECDVEEHSKVVKEGELGEKRKEESKLACLVGIYEPLVHE